MHLKALIALLSLAIVLVTSADDYYCDGESAVDNVEYGQLTKLIGNQWYILFTDDPFYVESCTTFKVDSSSYDDNDLVIKTYFEKNGLSQVVKGAYVVNSTQYLQYVEPGKFIMWNTGDPGFNPSQPGDVHELGQFTFTKFLKIPLIFDLDVIVFKNCFPTEGNQYKRYQHVAISRRNLSLSVFQILQTTLQSAGFKISENPCVINQNSIVTVTRSLMENQ